MIVPTFIRGLSDAYGSWKIICDRLRKRLSASPFSLLTSTPSKRTEPRDGRYKPRSARPTVVLPGARLADEGQGLAPPDCEGDAVDGVKQLRFPAPALRGHLEGDAEIVHLDQRPIAERPIAERPIAERAHDGDLTVTLTST